MNIKYFFTLFFIMQIPCVFFLKGQTFSESLRELDLVIESEIVKKGNLIEITIDSPHFKLFVIELVKDAIEKGYLYNLSNDLLTCYEQVCQGDNTFSVEHIKQILPELMYGLTILETKAPRPSLMESMVGPTTCDLSEVNRLVRELFELLSQCCANNSAAFNATFTALGDLEDTLTDCCAFVATEFAGTFSALNFGFNSTFSLLDVNFNGTFTIIEAINSNSAIVTFTNCFCENFIADLESCCTQVTNILSAFQSSVANATVLVGQLHNIEAQTNCILNFNFPLTTC